MSLAWMGRRAARWLLALGLLAVLVYALGQPQTPRVGLATAVAGVPVNRTAPPLTGDLRLGATLTCGRGVWDDPATSPYSYAFQWVRDNQDVTGETKTTHTLTASDIGRAIRCDVTATGDSGIREANSVTYYPPAPSALTPPRVSGDPRLGRTLSCTRGTWNDDGLPAYATNIAWYRSGDPIPGATNATYAITTADTGRQIYCRVAVGSLAYSNSPSVYPTAPSIRIIPAITGDLRLGGKLSCSRGVWDDEGIAAYGVAKQWLRDGQEILGATSDDYTVRLADIGHGVSCRVRAADLTDSNASTIYPTSPAQRTQPAISGDPRLGRTLTCTRGTWDDAGRASDYAVSYDWYRNGVQVSSGATYNVTALDMDKPLRCQITAEGISEVSSPTVYGVGPRNLTVPTLSGDARLGRSLSCSRGTWDDPGTPYTVSYQWYRSNQAVDGATSATYAITTADVNKGLYCRVTAAGFTSANSSQVSVQAPEAFLAPRIDGDPRVGSTLTCNRGDWDDPATPYAVTYQWFSNSAAVADATSASYVVQAGDASHSLFCRVNAEGFTNVNSPSVGITTQATGGTPVNLIAPQISGDRRLRHTLTCSRGSWNDPTTPYATSFRWRRGTVAIPQATTNTYTLTTDDVGQSINCQVTANAQTTATSASTSLTNPEVIIAPAISGDPRLRQTLSCSRGAWHEDPADRYTITYRWFRNSTAITGATSSTYTLTAADVGTTVYCEARAESLTSSGSAGVGVGAPRSVLGQVLAGQPRLRKTMSCSRGTWDDIADDRYAYATQWLRDGQAIDGATSGTYTVAAADTGHSVSCTVRAENFTNASPVNGSETVRAPANRVAPRLTGNPRIRQTLTCSRGDWDDEAADPYAVTYKWFRSSPQIANATANTYTTVRADVNQYLSCRVRAEDLTDANSAQVQIRQPDNRVGPQISGDPRLFRTLSCSRGDWDDQSGDQYAVTYSWFRSGVQIPGEPPSPHAATHDDINKQIYCRVRAEDFTDANSGSVSPALPRAIVPPQLSGEPHLRGELSCTRGTWDDTSDRRYSVSYQWYRSGQPISGATDPSYVLTTADLNRYITCTATAEVLRESSAQSLYVYGPSNTVSPEIQGIAHPRRELTCTRGEWNDSDGDRYVLSYQWLRNNQPIAGADSADHIVVAEDVGASLRCAVSAEGTSTAYSWWVYPTWEPLRITLAPDADASGPNVFNGYTLRVRNDNPVPVTITELDLTMPGGFSYRQGTTTGALTSDPQLTGPGSLTLRWTQDFDLPATGEAVVRVGVISGSALGDFLASARAIPANGNFTTPTADRTARVTVEGADPATCTITGTPGDDVLTGTPGNDVICGLAGDDTVSGLGGNDELWGGTGDDRVSGGDGDDTLRGGDGADVLDGQAGADVLRGGGGLDTVTYAKRAAPVQVTVGTPDGDDGEAGEADTVSSDAEIVRGGRGNDTITGGPGPEELYGNAGDDILDGGDGAGDLLDGGDGNDTLTDDDRLVDRVFCGGGWDRYNADLLDRVVGCEESFAIGEVE